MGADLVVRDILENRLADLESRNDPQRQLGDDPEPAEGEHAAAEFIRRGVPADRHQVPRRNDHRDLLHGVGQVRVADTGAVGSGRASSGHRDVRQRTGVRQGQPGRGQLPADLSVSGATAHPHQRSVRVDLDDARQIGDGDQISSCVRDPVEGVAGAQRPHRLRGADDLLNLADRRGTVETGGGEGDVAGPVGHRRHLRLARMHDRCSTSVHRVPAPAPSLLTPAERQSYRRSAEGQPGQ